MRFQGAAKPAALVAGAGHSTSLYGNAGAGTAPPALSWAPIMSSDHAGNDKANYEQAEVRESHLRLLT